MHKGYAKYACRDSSIEELVIRVGVHMEMNMQKSVKDLMKLVLV